MDSLPQKDIIEQEIHLRDYLQVALRRKWIIIVSFITVLTLATLHSFKTTPIYQASAQLQIDKENPNVVSFEEVMTMDSTDIQFYQTQYKILASKYLAQRVIDSLNLKNNPEFKSDEGSKGFSIRGFLSSLFRKDSQGSDKDDKKARLAEESRLLKAYLGRLSVEPIRNSRLVDIRFNGYNPVEITKIINKHAAEYRLRNLEVRFAASHDAAEWLQKQIFVKREALEKSETALQLYKEKEKIVSLEDKQNIIIQKLEDLSTEFTVAKTERMQLETLYNLAEEYSEDYEKQESMPGVMHSELIRQLKKEYSTLSAEVEKLSQRYGKNYPAMKRAIAQKNELKTRIVEETVKIINSIETKYKMALSKEKNLSKALEDQKEVALELNRKAIAYGSLRRDTEGERAMYDILLKRLKEADITGDLQTSNISIVGPATAPITPIKPRKKMNILLGMIVGLGMGIALVFFLEYLDNTIKSPEDIEAYLKIPLLGVLSHVNVQSKGKSATSELIVHEMPKSVFAEAVRNIRTSVMFSIIDTSRKLIMVTSATQGEGKTFVASNLAAVIASTGKKTLLVDTDLRKPRVNKVFSVEKNPGLCNHLLGEIELESIIKSTQVPNLSIVTCGNIPPNPSEIMHSAVMEKFCNAIRERFDMVIFDTPPAMTVTDAIILSSIVDGVIITIKSGSTVKDTAKRCVSQITTNKGEMLGAVVNEVDITRGGYYYHYYAHYYKYGYSSEKEWEEVEKT